MKNQIFRMIKKLFCHQVIFRLCHIAIVNLNKKYVCFPYSCEFNIIYKGRRIIFITKNRGDRPLTYARYQGTKDIRYQYSSIPLTETIIKGKRIEFIFF